MGFLDKLQFWKKSEPQVPSFDANFGGGFGADPNQNSFGNPSSMSGFSEQNAYGGQNMNDPFASPQQQADFNNPFDSHEQNPFANPQGQTMSGYGQSHNQMQSPSLASVSANTNNVSSYAPELHKKDIELILSRLDLIKSELDNVNHRLTLLEQDLKKPRW
jgi:hypothetical protein